MMIDLSERGTVNRAAFLLENLLQAVDFAVRWAIVGVVSIMVATVSVQVVLRYGLSASLDWAEEVSRLTFVWAVFLAIPLGIRRGAHVGMTFLVSLFPEGVQQILRRLMAAASIFLMAIVFYQSLLEVVRGWSESLTTVSLSVAWFTLPITIAAAHSMLHLLRLVLVDRTSQDEIYE